MRWMVAGVNEAGESCIVASGERHLGDEPSIERILVTEEVPPPPGASGAASMRDLGVGAGLLQWRVVNWGPNFELPMHNTDTIDLDCIIEGTVELILNDGPHVLGRGDCVIVPGVDHAWRTQHEGCVLTIALLGTRSRR